MGRNWARVFLLLPLYFTCIHSHGRLMDPPARNSMWRFGFGTPINYRLVFVRSSYSVASINQKYDKKNGEEIIEKMGGKLWKKM